jgi:Fe2+ or Zn2+ uptake regulation protein
MKTPHALTRGPGTVRDDILSLLSEEYPLTAKEIYSRVRRQMGKNVTYQAVHKTIKQMVEKKIVLKVGKGYQIAPEWVQHAKEYIQLLEKMFQHTPSAKKVLDSLPAPTTLHFTRYSELCVFVAQLLVDYREMKKAKMPHYVILWHIWWPLKFDFSMWDLFNKMDDQNPDNRVVVSQDTRFDQLVGKYYRLSNSAERLIVGLPLSERVEEDVMVRGDLVIQVKYSEETRKELHHIFNRIRSLIDLFHIYFIKGKQDGPFDITVTISENPTMARLVREKVKRYFNEK